MTDKAKSFIVPSPEAFEEIAKDHNLSRKQANELEVLVRHAHANLHGFLDGRLGRQAHAAEVESKRKFLIALDALIGSMGDPVAFNKYMPAGLPEALALGANPNLIEDVTDRPAFDWATDEKQSLETVGLKHGGVAPVSPDTQAVAV